MKSKHHDWCDAMEAAYRKAEANPARRLALVEELHRFALRSEASNAPADMRCRESARWLSLHCRVGIEERDTRRLRWDSIVNALRRMDPDATLGAAVRQRAARSGSKGAAGRRKYNAEDVARWVEMARTIEGAKIQKARTIAKRLKLSEKAVRSIREAI